MTDYSENKIVNTNTTLKLFSELVQYSNGVRNSKVTVSSYSLFGYDLVDILLRLCFVQTVETKPLSLRELLRLLFAHVLLRALKVALQRIQVLHYGVEIRHFCSQLLRAAAILLK